MIERHEQNLTGGCQCGAVRYEVHAAVEMIHYCHCRMCQRAVGNLFGVYAGAPRDCLVWVRGEPRLFQSSSMAARGFCAECGTPLSFAYHDSLFTWLTVGSLDHPERVIPERHLGIESQLPWLSLADDLPRDCTPDDPRYARMTIHQRAS